MAILGSIETKGELVASRLRLVRARFSRREKGSAMRGTVSATRGAVSATRGAISAMRGMVSAMRGMVSATRGTVSATRGTVSVARKASESSVLAIFALILMLFGFSQTVRAQGPSAEYKLKAVYLFNFLQYVDFPASAFASEKSPIVIGILGDDPFGRALDDMVAGESVKGHPVQVRRYARVKEVQDCQMLYISASESKRLNSILAALDNRSILTVSDADDFASRGGMIKLATENNKIRFRINVEAARAAKITISAKLLQLAEIASTEQRP
jgi:hypothetical protein